jgi:hypothetical protein
LTRLTYLDLSNNTLIGNIDALKGPTAQTNLGMIYNQFTGTIDAVEQMTSLTAVDLVHGHLTGSIPSGLAQLSSLKGMGLYNNDLSGTVPALPFKQYQNACCLSRGVRTNHFCRPHPPGAADCHCTGGVPGVSFDHDPCSGTSTDLIDSDCAAWQLHVRKSAYFTEATPPACQEPTHLTDPCNCTGVIGCSGGRITSVVLSHKLTKALRSTRVTKSA